MRDIEENSSINILNLSARSNNALKIAGIYTIKDLLLAEEKNIRVISRIGEKSFKEIMEIREKLNNSYTPELFIKNDMREKKEEEIRKFLSENDHLYKDISIKEAPLSVRAKNCLRRSNIFYLSELLKKDDDEFLAIRNMGLKTLQEIKDYKGSIILEKFEETDLPNKKEEVKIINPIYIDYIKNISYLLKIGYANLYTNLKEELDKDGLKEADLQKLIYSTETGQEKWDNYVLKLIKEEIYGIEEVELYTLLPDELKNVKIFNQVLENLLYIKKEIDLPYDDRLVAVYESFKDGLSKYLSGDQLDILLKRLSGKILSEIGDEYGVTRERIRQIEARAIRTINNMEIKFKEDFYYDIFYRYAIDKEIFKTCIGDVEIFNYLDLRYGKKIKENLPKRKELEKILEDRKIPKSIRELFNKYIYKDYIQIGSDRVHLSRDGLDEYILKTYARNDLHLDDFKEIYLTLLKDLSLSAEEADKLSFMGRGHENRLSRNNSVLWKYGRKIRYYDINSYDFQELLETLSLNNYQDVEYSAAKFLNMYPELMQAYDMRDPYELHNLLKKICSEGEYPQVKFNRMPNIEFGNANRDKQALDALFNLEQPVAGEDFAKAYEEEYGVISETVLANYVDSIKKYYHDGYFNVDFPDLSDLAKEKLTSLLTEDFYTLNQVKEIFNQELPHEDKNNLNARSIKKLGFIVLGNYIINDKFSTASEYFTHVLTRNNITDLKFINPGICEQTTFYAILYKLKEDYDLIEFSPDKYINIRRLQEFGVTKDTLQEYSKNLLAFAGRGKYFTIQSIREEGFGHSLDDLGFEEYFYTSLVIEDKDNFSYLRIGGNKIILSNKYDFTFGDFLENIIFAQEELYMDIYDLLSLLKEEYDIKIDLNKLISYINSSTMHYDYISEQVFADYDTYYEVI